MKKYILTFTVTINILFAEFYTDRFLVYINNSETNFMLNEEIGRTNHKELNQKLDEVSALNIHQWLFNARPTDRDGNIYLNRYYVVQFAENRQWLSGFIDYKVGVDGISILFIILTTFITPICIICPFIPHIYIIPL